MKAFKKNVVFFIIVLNFTSFGFQCPTPIRKSEEGIVIKNKDVLRDSLINTKDIYIKELLKLNNAITTANNEELASFFEFPTSNFLFVPRTPDVRMILNNNNGKLTKDAFLKYCKPNVSGRYMSLKVLFNTLNVNDLRRKDNIFKKIEIKDDECYYFYQIAVQEDLIVLSYGSNTNDKYITEGCECNERSLFFYFKLVDDKLKFSNSEIAG